MYTIISQEDTAKSNVICANWRALIQIEFKYKNMSGHIYQPVFSMVAICKQINKKQQIIWLDTKNSPTNRRYPWKWKWNTKSRLTAWNGDAKISLAVDGMCSEIQKYGGLTVKLELESTFKSLVFSLLSSLSNYGYPNSEVYTILSLKKM